MGYKVFKMPFIVASVNITHWMRFLLSKVENTAEGNSRRPKKMGNILRAWRFSQLLL